MNNLKNILIFFLLIISIFSFTSLYSIEQNSNNFYFDENNWIYSIINITDNPSESIVTNIDISFEISGSNLNGIHVILVNSKNEGLSLLQSQLGGGQTINQTIPW